MRNLRQEYIHAQNEVKRIASIPLMIGHFLEGIDPNTCIVAPTSGQNYYVRLGFIRLSFGTMLASVNPWLQNFIDGRSWKIETIRSSLSSQAFSFAGRRSSTRIWLIYSGFSWNYFRRIIVFDKSLFSISHYFRRVGVSTRLFLRWIIEIFQLLKVGWRQAKCDVFWHWWSGFSETRRVFNLILIG